MNKKRWLALFVAFVVLLGTFPFTAFAEDESDSGATETFMCGLEESVGHEHSDECYCAGGEYLCTSEETEEHFHTEVCVCPGGELVCLSDEFDGHTHSETCVAKSDEPACGTETTALSDDNNTKALLTESEYEDLKQLFAADESIAFDPATQTLLVIEAEHIQTAHLQSLGLANVEDAIQWDGEENGYKTPFLVNINGEKVKKDHPYYIVSKDTMSIAEMKVSKAYGFGEGKVFLSADNNKLAVLIVNQGDTYNVAWEMNSDTFYNAAVTGHAYNGHGLCPFPTNHQTRTAYSGTAGSTPVKMPFSFEWDLYNWLDIEIWMADMATKTLDFAGFLNATGYINFKFELREKNGNITLLPRSFLNNLGSANDFVYMAEDGIVSVPLEAYDESLLPQSTPYGEFDILIPFGYDYRITLLDYSVDELGGYAYVMNQEHGYDADGFCITNKSPEYQENKEWGSWLGFTFMPRTQVIRVEKQAEGSDSADKEYTFAAKQSAYTYSQLGEYKFQTQPDSMQGLTNYPYDLYDSKTDEKINEKQLKTDESGNFKLKSGQYAEFKVWEVPEDILDYERWGTNFIDDIYTVYSDVPTESEYTFEELGAGDCATKITHKRGDTEATVSGKKIENVLGNDRILFRNIYDRTGSLTIRKEVSGSGTPDSDTAFEFTVSKEGKTAVGKYTIGNGAEQTIPADGKISLKAGESALLTGLEPGEYTVTETTPTQPNYINTGFSINHDTVQTGLTATVTVTSTAAEATGGWEMKNGSIAKDADGYFVYTITKDQMDADGKIIVDCDPLAEYMEMAMRAYQNFSSFKFKVKFVNETGTAIRYQDYNFDTVNWIPVGGTYTPSAEPTMLNTEDGADENSAGYGWAEAWQTLYPMLSGKSLATATVNAAGFDGNPVRLALAPLRCINPAIISYFKSNPGYGTLTGSSSTNSASSITLLQMSAFPELIKQSFVFEDYQGNTVILAADSERTYADFICEFYQVSSLDELTVAQKYNVLGTGSAGSPGVAKSGQANISTYYSNLSGNLGNRCIPYSALNDGTLDYFKTWGMSGGRIAAGKQLIYGGQVFTEEDAAAYAYQPNFYLLESDSEIIKMAYEYLYERCMRITFDHGNRPLSTAWDDSATPAQDVSSVKSYLDKTDAAKANVLAAMNQGNQIADRETITLDNMRGYIEVPNAWSVFRYYDFGFELIFRADTVPEDEPAASVVFTNNYQRNDTPSPEPDHETGDLEVSLTVSGNDADRTKDFTFTVTLGDASVNGSYGELTFENGIAVFTLKDGESKTGRSLPAGISFTVEESDNAGYTVTVNGSSQATATGSIVANTTAKAAFNNHKEDLTPDENTMEVTVMKVWDDNDGENRPSSVEVQLYKDGEACGEPVVLNAENGWMHTWAQLDSKALWTVDEVNVPAGYRKTVTHSGGNWTITNTPDAPDDTPNTPDTPPTQPPLTGDDSQIGLWTALACLSLILILALVLYMRRFSAQK